MYRRILGPVYDNEEENWRILTNNNNNNNNNNNTITKRDRKKLNVLERKVYMRILGPVYDNETENWRILTNKEIYASVKKPTVIETIRLNDFVGLDIYREWKKIEFPKEYCI